MKITGGEPILRKNLSDLIDKLSSISGINDIAPTTNGYYLPLYSKPPKEAGLKRVNISLDAIEDSVFTKMNGRNVKVTSILKGIFAAKKWSLFGKRNTGKMGNRGLEISLRRKVTLLENRIRKSLVMIELLLIPHIQKTVRAPKITWTFIDFKDGK